MKTIKVAYVCRPKAPNILGIIDAGIDAVCTFVNGVLTIKGPKIDLTVDDVLSFSATEVEI